MALSIGGLFAVTLKREGAMTDVGNVIVVQLGRHGLT